MAVITVKEKNAVLIPASVMRKARTKVGDILNARVERGAITLTPKSASERGIEQGLDDIKGRPGLRTLRVIHRGEASIRPANIRAETAEADSIIDDASGLFEAL
jgi:hypothetical protein